MGPDLDLIGKSESRMEASSSKRNRIVTGRHESYHVAGGSKLKYRSEMNTSLAVHHEQACRKEDMEVNIMECNFSGDNDVVHVESGDTTEDSSSFADTEAENGDYGAYAEVASKYHGATSSMPDYSECDDFLQMRNKGVTSHWRTFVQPLYWRCKWLELKVKMFESQAMKYDNVVGEIKQRRQLELGSFAVDRLGAKAVPFTSNPKQERVMKRKKRRRTEDLKNAETYMAEHNIFSFFASRNTNAVGPSANHNLANPVISVEAKVEENTESPVKGELLSLDFRNDDSYVEQILRKIGAMQSQVHEMKTRLNKVLSENEGKFLSSADLSMTEFGQISTLRNNEDVKATGPCSASRPMPVSDTRCAVIPASTGPSNGEFANLPEINQNADQLLAGTSIKNSGDQVVVYNRRAKKDQDEFGEEQKPHVEQIKVPKEEQYSIVPQTVAPKQLQRGDQPALKLHTLPTVNTSTKGTRTRRNAGSGMFSWRSSG